MTDCDRIVIDTNVFVSALLQDQTPPRWLIRQCLQGNIQPVMGTALFCEYESVISRSEIYGRSILDKKERELLLDAFLSICHWVSVYYLWRPNLRDEADNHLIELAVAGQAEHIITGNTKDFQNGELIFPQVKIVTPQNFMQKMRN